MEETMPFMRVKDERSQHTICLCVGGKWFCFYNPLLPDFCCLKCAPDKISALQNQYEGITPGWHMNKKHWISVYFHSDVPDSLFCDLLRQGYELVLSSLPKKKQAVIRALPPQADMAPEWQPPRYRH